MHFNVEQKYENERATKEIIISCPTATTWSCHVEGNFGLNVYEGVGPRSNGSSQKKLEIVFFDDDDKTAYGNIIFYYYDDGCLKHLSAPIFYAEKDNWLNIFPTEDIFSNSLTNEYKVFTLKSNIPKENIQIYVPNEKNYTCFITENLKLYLIKKNAINTRITLDTSVIQNSTNNTEDYYGFITVLEENLTD